MTLRVNSLGVNTQSNSDSAATLISNRALVDLNETGIVTSGGSVTRWNNSANRNQSCYFNGTNAYVSTPDSGALALTGDVQTWTIYGVAAVDWTPANSDVLAGQYDTVTNSRRWNASVVAPTGEVTFYTSLDGITPVVATFPSPVFVDGQAYDIKFSRVSSTGMITAYTTPAGGTFVQLGTPQLGAVGALSTIATPLTIGARLSSGSPVAFFNGTIQRFTLHDDDRLAASWDARLQDDYNSSTLESVGPELFTNGDFSSATGWFISPERAAISDGVLTFSAGGDVYAYQDVMEIGGVYDITLDYNITSGEAGLYYGSNSGTGTAIQDMGALTGVGSITKRVTATAARLVLRDTSGCVATFDNLSCKRVSTYTSTNAIYRDPYDLDKVQGTGANLIKHESGAAAFNGVSGSYISAPDSPANSITGDIEIRWFGTISTATRSANMVLAAKFEADPENGYLVYLTPGSIVTFIHSADGTASLSGSSTVAVPVGTVGIKAKLDVDNGVTGHTKTFYTTADGITWDLLGAPVVTAGVTSIADTTALLEIGSYDAGTLLPSKLPVTRVQIINGILPQGLEFDEEVWTGAASVASGWTDNGDGTFTAVTPNSNIIGASNIESGVEYEISFTMSNYVAGSARLNNAIGAFTGAGVVSQSANGTQTRTITATAAGAVYLYADSSFVGTISGVTVKPTAAIAVDFNPSLAGRSANGVDGDTFFGAEMLSPSARVINATDWAESGTGSITNNGDGTVTIDDQDTLADKYYVNKATTIADNSASYRYSVRLAQGTATQSAIRLVLTGGTTSNNVVEYTWATGAISLSGTSPTNPQAVDNGDGTVTLSLTAVNNATGNTSALARVYAAGLAAGVTGSVIVHGDVSLQSQWTLHGGTAIQNSGTAEVRSWGSAGIETTVAPALIPTPMTMYMVGKADNPSVTAFFTASRSDAASSPQILTAAGASLFNGGGTNLSIAGLDTAAHLHTVRHNTGAAEYSVSGLGSTTGATSSEPYEFGTFFASLAGGQTLTGSIGRYILFDEELNDSEVEFVQTLLLPN